MQQQLATPTLKVCKRCSKLRAINLFKDSQKSSNSYKICKDCRNRRRSERKQEARQIQHQEGMLLEVDVEMLDIFDLAGRFARIVGDVARGANIQQLQPAAKMAMEIWKGYWKRQDKDMEVNAA